MNGQKTSILLLIICSLFVLAACGSPLKSYNQGKYLTASEEAVNVLRKKPDNAQARDVLAKAYPKVLEEAHAGADSLSFEDIDENNLVIDFLERWNKLVDNINNCPAALEIIPHPESYTKELGELKNYTVRLAYNQGLEALEKHNLQDARLALGYLTTAHKYAPENAAVKDALEEARYAATLRVVINRPNFMFGSRLDAEYLFDRQLMDELNHRSYRQPVKFFRNSDMVRHPQQEIFFDFENFTVGHAVPSTHVETVSQRVVVGHNLVDGELVPVYDEVVAVVTVYRLEMIAEGVLHLRITDLETHRWLSQRDFRRTAVWFSEWATYTGDARALTSTYLSLVGMQPLPAPAGDILYDDVIRQLYRDAVQYIGSIY